MEKSSFNYIEGTSEVALEFEMPESDDNIASNDILDFIDSMSLNYILRSSYFIIVDYHSPWSTDTFSNDSSLNPIYFPHAPPSLT